MKEEYCKMIEGLIKNLKNEQKKIILSYHLKLLSSPDRSSDNILKIFNDNVISILASELVYSIQDIIAIKNIICFIHWERLDVFFEKVLKNVFEKKILEKEKNKKYLAIYITLVDDSNYQQYATYIKPHMFLADKGLIHHEFSSLGFLADHRPEEFRYYLFYKLFLLLSLIIFIKFYQSMKSIVKSINQFSKI